MPLFENISYHLSQSLAEQTRLEISRILDSNGAIEVPIGLATHILSDTIEFEGCDNLRRGIPCVTPYWVERSMELGHLQDPKHFSADREMFFSGVVATSADLPSGDKEVIASGILAQGGAWREGLTRDVTHLFVTNTRSEKYQTAMHFRDSAHIRIVLPQWFDQCWSTQMLLPSDVFQFPDPPYLRKDHDIAAYKAQLLVKHTDTSHHLANGLDKQAMYGTMQASDMSSPPATRSRDIWQGRSILLSPSLELDTQRRESVEARIRRAGGVVVIAQEENESIAIEQADILITRFRTGAAYVKGLTAGKTIGTLAWLFYVERTGILSRPRDQLLHYPVRAKPIQGFSGHEITVTNYQGDAREYLKKLIEVMGARFTPTMSGRNTVVVAAYKGGNKTIKAEEWSVPVVTHKWLEDCFVEWRNLTPAQKKYLDYAPGVNYGTVLGDRGVGRIGLEEDMESLPETKAELAPTTNQTRQPKPAEGNKPEKGNATTEGLDGIPASIREALEVEEVEDALQTGGVPHEDRSARKGPSVTPKKLGPPRGVKTPMKEHPADDLPSAKSRSQRNPISVAPVQTKDTDVLLSIAAPEISGRGSTSKPPQVDLDVESAPVEAPMKIGPPVKPKSKPKATSTTLPNELDDGDDGSGVEVPLPEVNTKSHREKESAALETMRVTKSTSKPNPKSNLARTRLVSDHGSDQESTNEVENEKPISKARTIQMKTNDDINEDVFTPQAKQKSKPIVYKSRNHVEKPIHDQEGSKQDKATLKAKVKQASPTSGSESDEIKLHVSKKFTRTHNLLISGNGEAALQPSPNRIVSVDLPDPRSLLAAACRSFPEFTPRSRPGSRAKKPRDLTSPIHIIAKDASGSSPRRGRPSINRNSTSQSPPPSPRRSQRRLQSSSIAAAQKVGTGLSDLSSPPSHQRVSSNRLAAVAATQKLRDKVMPDVVNFENERKRGMKGGLGRKRKGVLLTSSSDSEKAEEDDFDNKSPKKRKIADHDDNNRKGKSKALARSVPEDSDAPPSRFVTNTKSSKRLADVADKPLKRVRIDKSLSEQESETEGILSRTSYDPKKIRILTTKVTVTEELEKALTKLGLKFTQKPHECTHLITNYLSRTEKFLCALPNAPFVLNMDWLIACSETRSVVAEDGYVLHDPDMEHKHKFKLVDALERAKELKRKKHKLLQGHFFYLTPAVPSDFNVLKNVMHALGAECKASIPTIRNISDTRHIISSLKDERLWRPLVKHGVTVYSHELIISAALTQFVDWDGEDKILARRN